MALQAGPESEKNDDRPRVALRAAMRTDVGVVREHNEDAAHVDEGNEFFIVADGMGGHAAGEVASAMAVDIVTNALKEAHDQIEAFVKEPTDAGRKAIVTLLETAVRGAHQAVFDRGARETDKQGMGTTLDVVLLAGAEAFVAHVGDSRTYLIRDGKAAQVTTDHTVAEVLVIEGKLSVEEAQISPLRTILVNAIGVAPDVGVEMAHIQLRAGDELLLSSDGLHDYFPLDQELAERLAGEEPDKALEVLVELAKERGGHDNITGVVVQVLEVPPSLVVEAAPTATAAELSDGVPAPIDRDDTLPVDVGTEPPPRSHSAASSGGRAATRSTDPMPAVEPPLTGDEDTMEIEQQADSGGRNAKQEPAGDDEAADDEAADEEPAGDAGDEAADEET